MWKELERPRSPESQAGRADTDEPQYGIHVPKQGAVCGGVGIRPVISDQRTNGECVNKSPPLL
ncbi:hypothetical protein EYF80_015379 [Liparis tanakae]|uniref:Uncharacterized protein n=1 Tax=Liparis tanakae TaxID=230148 RepID=A0A4Z2I967_9TELE|nr:hypothetical protein EYF80_015379 [Liparis tanakae]